MPIYFQKLIYFNKWFNTHNSNAYYKSNFEFSDGIILTWEDINSIIENQTQTSSDVNMTTQSLDDQYDLLTQSMASFDSGSEESSVQNSNINIQEYFEH